VWKISPPPGFDPQTVQPVASRYTDYAIWPITGHSKTYIFQKLKLKNTENDPLSFVQLQITNWARTKTTVSPVNLFMVTAPPPKKKNAIF
jgi:hypothetical protein